MKFIVVNAFKYGQFVNYYKLLQQVKFVYNSDGKVYLSKTIRNSKTKQKKLQVVQCNYCPVENR